MEEATIYTNPFSLEQHRKKVKHLKAKVVDIFAEIRGFLTPLKVLVCPRICAIAN